LANPTPTDPEILIDIGCCSDSLQNQFNEVQPDGTSTSLVFDFKNDTGGIVTSLTFDTTINKSLSQDQINSGFGCPEDSHYFLSCDTPYDPTTGALQYRFFGVNPADGDEMSGDTEFGEYEGIPLGGDFKVTLQGWTTGATAGDGTALFNGVPKLSNGFTAPEPSQLLLLAVECLLLVSIAGIIRRRAKRKENSPTV
jgi:hypothetical protein